MLKQIHNVKEIFKMGKLHTDRKGFSAVEIILVLVVIGVLGAVGYTVYAKQHKTTPVNSGNNTTAKDMPAENPTAVFKIDGFGVQFTVPETLKGLTYKVVNVDYSQPGTNTLGTSPTAYLSTTALNAAEGGKCDISSATPTAGTVPPLGFLVKTTGQYPVEPTSDNATGKLVKQYPTYYIAYRSAGMSCFSEQANIETVTKLNTQLSAALKTISETSTAETL